MYILKLVNVSKQTAWPEDNRIHISADCHSEFEEHGRRTQDNNVQKQEVEQTMVLTTIQLQVSKHTLSLMPSSRANSFVN
jgi:hypothetical protein